MDTLTILECLQQDAKGLPLSTLKVHIAALLVYLKRNLQEDLLISRFCRVVAEKTA